MDYYYIAFFLFGSAVSMFVMMKYADKVVQEMRMIQELKDLHSELLIIVDEQQCENPKLLWCAEKVLRTLEHTLSAYRLPWQPAQKFYPFRN